MRSESSGTWALRWGTFIALLQLVRARALVRFMPFSAWRDSLGQLSEEGVHQEFAGELANALVWARRVERAANRLPGRSKCLPKAMALQWILRRYAIASRLVIAMHKTDRQHDHSFHAWVEVGGEMIIGHCDRASYSSMASFDQFG